MQQSQFLEVRKLPKMEGVAYLEGRLTSYKYGLYSYNYHMYTSLPNKINAQFFLTLLFVNCIRSLLLCLNMYIRVYGLTVTPGLCMYGSGPAFP